MTRRAFSRRGRAHVEDCTQKHQPGVKHKLPPPGPGARPAIEARELGLCVCDVYGMCPQGCQHCSVCGGE
jgi:hypothetical protein